jgi:hypothetical protein
VSDSFHFQVRLIRLNFRLILILGGDLGELGEKGSILGELGFRHNSPNSPISLLKVENFFA